MEAHECPADSKRCPGCGNIKPLTDYYFDKSVGRYMSRCKDCTNERYRQSYQKQKDKKLKACAEYRNANKEKVKAYLAEWYERNSARVLERCKEYNARPEVRARESERQKLRYESNRETILQQRKVFYERNPQAIERNRQRLSQHYRDNKPAYYAKRMKRIAAQLQAMPAWADPKAIVAIYEDCLAKSAETGVPHEVDHIIPLQGKLVCGLHVQDNLRVITASENRSKSNKHTA